MFSFFLFSQESSAPKTASLIKKCVLRQNSKYRKTKKLFNLTKTAIYKQTVNQKYTIIYNISEKTKPLIMNTGLLSTGRNLLNAARFPA